MNLEQQLIRVSSAAVKEGNLVGCGGEGEVEIRGNGMGSRV